MNKMKIKIFLFDDVEVLDFAGPFEVFSVTNELSDYTLFEIETVSRTGGNIIARNGLVVGTDRSIFDADHADILIIPGGSGTRPILHQNEVIDWIRDTSIKSELTLSVCTGALLLAKARLLEGLRATTHHQVFEELEDLASNTDIIRSERFVDSGKIITSAGISAGIDMCLYVVERLYGRETADETAAYMEYRRHV